MSYWPGDTTGADDIAPFTLFEATAPFETLLDATNTETSKTLAAFLRSCGVEWPEGVGPLTLRKHVSQADLSTRTDQTTERAFFTLAEEHRSLRERETRRMSMRPSTPEQTRTTTPKVNPVLTVISIHKTFARLAKEEIADLERQLADARAEIEAERQRHRACCDRTFRK